MGFKLLGFLIPGRVNRKVVPAAANVLDLNALVTVIYVESTVIVGVAGNPEKALAPEAVKVVSEIVI